MGNQNRHPAGASGSKGGEFALSTYGKDNIPTAEAVATLVKQVDVLETATDNGTDNSWDAYAKARTQLDEAFKSLLPEKIANLKVGDEVDFVFLNPDYEGNRAEIKASNAIISESMLQDLKDETISISEGFFLLDILPSREPIIDPEETSLTVTQEDGTVTKISYQDDPEQAIEDFEKLLTKM